MNRKLCFKNSSYCWSLHALWDAELLKMIKPIDIIEFDQIKSMKFDIEKWAIQMNRLVCEIYQYPDDFGIEEYVEKFKNISIYLVKMASSNIASVLNTKGLDPRQFAGND